MILRATTRFIRSDRDEILMTYIIQFEGKDIERVLQLMKKNKDLEVVKIIAKTNNVYLVNILKRYYNITVWKQDVLFL